nr:hypothetical protein [Bradyrhizobium sp. Oc8]
MPKEKGDGRPVSQRWFEDFLEELSGNFGGATSFVRAPGHGLWRSGEESLGDNIAVIEVMAAKLAPEFWRSLRDRLERELSQEEIVIRAQEIIVL